MAHHVNRFSFQCCHFKFDVCCDFHCFDCLRGCPGSACHQRVKDRLRQKQSSLAMRVGRRSLRRETRELLIVDWIGHGKAFVIDRREH